MEATSPEMQQASTKVAKPTSTTLPAFNASLNFTAAILLVIGYVLVRKRRFEAHKKVMLAAFAVSAIFLTSYLYYHFNFESARFLGTGWIRPVYFFVLLIPHVVLATVMVPFILWMLVAAFRGQLVLHRRIARYVWPVWMYTSVTGVLVYLALYRWGGAQT